MIDKLSQGESLEQDSVLGNIQKQTQEVICRVFFVRHGQSKDEAINPWLPQDQNAELSKLWEDQIHKVWQKFAELWVNDMTAVIVYAWWTKRIIQSKKELEKYNIGVTKWNSLENSLLETTKKKYNPETKTIESEKSHMQGVAEQLKNIVDLVHWEILSSFKQNDGIYSDKKNIILLGHKSSEGFPELANESKEDTILHGLRIKPGEMFELDIGADNKLINYEKNKDILHLTVDNYGDILKILWEEEVISKEIKRCTDKEIQIFELQNLINDNFKGHPEMYERNLSSENEDLRVFCLANLIRLKRYKNIYIFLEKDLKLRSISEQKNIFDIIKKEKNILENFLQIFFEDKKDSNEYTNLKSYMIEELLKLWDDQVLLMNYYENIYPLVKDIREKSLDMRIVNWEDIHPEFNFDGRILNRKIDNMIKKIKYINIIEKSEHLNIDVNIRVKKAISRVMSRNTDHHIWHYIYWAGEKILYIEANSGTGKSFLLSQINEKIKDTNFMMDGVINNSNFGIDKSKIFPIFINLSGQGSIKSIKDKIQSIQNNYKRPKCGKNSIVILDSLDESNFNGEERKELLTYLSNKSELSSDVIITSRNGYISKDASDSDRWDIVKKIDIVQLKEMDDINVDSYVKEYFGDKIDNSRKIEEFNRCKNNQRLHGIEKNPLILSMICYLIKTWDDIKSITSIWDLYGQIVDLRLRYREDKKNIQWRKIVVNQENSEKKKEEDIQRIINRRKEFLWELAYQEVVEWKHIDEDSFSMLNEKYPWLIPDNDCLNLLFKKNNNSKEYDFVHQSFKEFLVVKYITKNWWIFAKLFHGQKDEVIKAAEWWKLILLYWNDGEKRMLDNIDFRGKSAEIILDYLCERYNDHLTKEIIIYFIRNHYKKLTIKSLEKCLHFIIKSWDAYWIKYMMENYINKKSKIVFKKGDEKGGMTYEDIINHACGNLNIEMVEYFLDFYKKYEKDIDIGNILLSPIYSGNNEITKYLFNRYRDKILYNYRPVDWKRMLLVLRQLAVLAIDFKDRERKSRNKYQKFNFDKALDIAINHENIDIIKFLMENYGDKIDLWDWDMIVEMCRDQKTKSLKFLFENYIDRLNLDSIKSLWGDEEEKNRIQTMLSEENKLLSRTEWEYNAAHFIKTYGDRIIFDQVDNNWITTLEYIFRYSDMDTIDYVLENYISKNKDKYKKTISIIGLCDFWKFKKIEYLIGKYEEFIDIYKTDRNWSNCMNKLCEYLRDGYIRGYKWADYDWCKKIMYYLIWKDEIFITTIVNFLFNLYKPIFNKDTRDIEFLNFLSKFDNNKIADTAKKILSDMKK